jgi:hypothetical protein
VLRVVRRLPIAEVYQNVAALARQVLDKHQGRKPRAISQRSSRATDYGDLSIAVSVDVASGEVKLSAKPHDWYE